LDKESWFFVKSCLLGDGSLTPITKNGRNTIMLSFTHCTQQKPWLQAKADKLNAIFNRNCKVGERDVFDQRTGKTYGSCQFSLTSKEFIPLYEIAYPNGKKQFTEKLLEGLGAEYLAVLWADDGGLEPKARVGRIHAYEPEDQCNIIIDWVKSVCGAVGRYEDYEKVKTGRIRYPATEMMKIVIAIKPYLHESMFYKIDMQYKNNTKVALAVSSPNDEVPELDLLPEVDELSWSEWSALAKKAGVAASKNGSKQSLRQRIVEVLMVINGR
jgi:hypothetical protein